MPKQKRKSKAVLVLIFYSSETEPDILDFFTEPLTFLRQQKIKFNIIDVFKNPTAGRKNKIIATPTVIVKKGRKEIRHLGIIAGLKTLLMEDLQGRAMLHLMSLKEGRDAGRNLAQVPDDEFEIALRSLLGHRKMGVPHMVKLHRKDHQVTIEIERSKEDSSPTFEVKGFLTGIFTEYFERGIALKETRTKDNNLAFST